MKEKQQDEFKYDSKFKLKKVKTNINRACDHLHRNFLQKMMMRIIERSTCFQIFAILMRYFCDFALFVAVLHWFDKSERWKYFFAHFAIKRWLLDSSENWSEHFCYGNEKVSEKCEKFCRVYFFVFVGTFWWFCCWFAAPSTEFQQRKFHVRRSNIVNGII